MWVLPVMKILSATSVLLITGSRSVARAVIVSHLLVPKSPVA